MIYNFNYLQNKKIHDESFLFNGLININHISLVKNENEINRKKFEVELYIKLTHHFFQCLNYYLY